MLPSYVDIAGWIIILPRTVSFSKLTGAKI